MKQVHLKGLNGIRAIAACAVIVSHTTTSLKNFDLNPYIFGRLNNGEPAGVNLGGFGVSMFFCLSGFLITYLLLLEKSEAEINIRNFYIRRILRIWPIYYLYLVICLIPIFYLHLYFNLGSLLCYIFYAANIPFILNIALPLLNHYWSLGVEEQFYSFWPWIVKKAKSLKALIFIVIIALIVLKLFVRYTYGDLSIVYSVIHVTRFHCMLIGALGATYYFERQPLFMKVFSNKILQALAWFAVLLMAVNKFHFASVLDNELVSAITLLIIVGQITVRSRLLNLENDFFDFLGKISYGMYVYHPLVIFGLGYVLKTAWMPSAMSYPIVYIANLGLTIIIAYLSYEYFEKWFLKRKVRYSAIKSISSKHF